MTALLFFTESLSVARVRANGESLWNTYLATN